MQNENKKKQLTFAEMQVPSKANFARESTKSPWSTKTLQYQLRKNLP